MPASPRPHSLTLYVNFWATWMVRAKKCFSDPPSCTVCGISQHIRAGHGALELPPNSATGTACEQSHPFTCQQVHFSKSKMRAIFCFLEVSPNLSILTPLNEKVCVVGRLYSNAMLYDRWGISVWTRWDIIESWLNQVTHHGRTCGWKTTLLLGSKSNEHRFEIQLALDS